MINIQNSLKWVLGVFDVIIFSIVDYFMWLWFDFLKMMAFNIIFDDIVVVLWEQNVQVLAGCIGVFFFDGNRSIEYML